MPNPDRIRVLTLIESATVTGPSRILLDFAAKAGSPEPELPAIDLTVLTFHRGTGECTLAAAAERVGVPAIVIPERGRWDPGVMSRLRRAVEAFKPDILESRNVKSHFFIRVTGLHKRFPWIAWNHGYTSKDRLDRAYNKLDRWSLRGAFRVMTVCRPFADAIEAVAWRDHPCVGRGTPQVFAEVFEDGGMLGGNGGKVVECFVDAGGEACGCNVMAQNSLVGDMRKEARLRSHFSQHVRNIFLALGSEGFLIASAAAEGDHDDLALFTGGLGTDEGARLHHRGTEGQSCCTAQKLPAAAAYSAGDLTRR